MAIAAIAACSSSDSNNGNSTAGAAGAGTAGAGTAGAGIAGTGTAGAGTAGAGTAGAGTAGAGTAGAGGTTTCAPATGALITSFADTVAATDTANSGGLTFMAGIPGGTFSYQPPAVFTLSAATQALEVKGTVNGYDGFGIYFNACTDASAYTGVSFNIKGNVGASGMLSFRFHNVANEPVKNNGTCVVPATSTEYDACHYATFPITVTTGGSNVSVKFSDVMGGFPVTTVDAKDLVGLEWAFTWTEPAAGTAGAGGATAGAGGATAGAGGATAGAGGATAGSGGSGGASVAGSYAVDVTIDDIMFTGGPAGGGAGGAGGTSGTAGAGGATAGAGGKGGAGGAGGAAAGAGGAAAGAGGATAGAGGKGGAGGAGGSAGKGGGQ